MRRDMIALERFICIFKCLNEWFLVWACGKTGLQRSGDFYVRFHGNRKIGGGGTVKIWVEVITWLFFAIPGWTASAPRLVPETDLAYLGAFRMPGELPTFHYNWGQALAFYPQGNGGQGSLFINQGVVGPTDGSGWQTAEISIPEPVNSKNVDFLPRAEALQFFFQIAVMCPDCDGLGGLAYLDKLGDQAAGKLYWGVYDYYGAAGIDYLSLGWSGVTLNAAGSQGPWHVGEARVNHLNKVGKYLLEADHTWSDTYTGGRYLLTGRHREAGGQGGSKGPTLYAIAPWAQGNPPLAGSNLSDVTLLEYPSGASGLPTKFPDYSANDTWNGAVWIKAGEKQAVLMVGEKGTGTNTCYGTSPAECNDPCSIDKGYHSYPYSPRFIWYDVNDLALVAQGGKAPGDVIPYSSWTPLENTWDTGACSAGYGGVAFDRDRGRLYVAELNADSGAPIVHVFQVNADGAAPREPRGLKVR